jgi:hypothetical protein
MKEIEKDKKYPALRTLLCRTDINLSEALSLDSLPLPVCTSTIHKYNIDERQHYINITIIFPPSIVIPIGQANHSSTCKGGIEQTIAHYLPNLH